MSYLDNGFRFKDLKIEHKNLFCRGKDTGWSLTQDTEYKHMYWINFEDSSKSADFYNLERAKENMCLLYLSEVNRTVTESLGKAQGEV